MPGRTFSPAFLFPASFASQTMQMIKSPSSRKYAIWSLLFVLFVAYYPQTHLIASRGSAWSGSFYVTNYDETAYATYINTLISGKSRKADPFSGTDNASYESFYSIQFVPAYAIALPARSLGLSTSTAFILLIGFIAIATALALFWLIKSVGGDDLLAAAGTIFVLAFGTAAAFEGELRHLVQGSVVVDYFPFLRRYQPGLPFPLYLFYLGALWKALSATDRRKGLVSAVAAGCSVAVMIFSYFFLWTTALAFLSVLVILAFVLVPNRRRRILTALGTVAIISTAALVPYWFFISRRSPEIDSVQLLAQTRAPDLFSTPIVIGVVVVLAALVLLRRNYLRLSDPLIIFTLAVGLTPLVVLNQQVVSGRSLQPVHFEIFVTNYLALIAVVMLFAALMNSQKATVPAATLRKALMYMAVISAAWGTVETVTATNRSSFAAEVRDRAASAIKLAEKDSAGSKAVVLTPDMVTGDFIQSVSNLHPLWSPHTSSGGGVSLSENKRLFYLYIYQNGVTDKELGNALRARVFEVTAAVFGSEQALPELGGDGQTISDAAVQAEVSKYREFVSFAERVGIYEPVLNYIVVASEAEPDYSRLDRWYRRELLGDADGFKAYKLTAKR